MNQLRKKIREEFKLLDSLFFNTAYFGPSPLRAKLAMEKAVQKEVNPSFTPYEDWTSIPDKVRNTLAKMLNLPSQQIFHSTSVSEIMGLLSHQLPLKQNDVVVGIQGDYPSNVLSWMSGAQLGKYKYTSLPYYSTPEEILAALPSSTKVFVTSHVFFDSGRKIDLLTLGRGLKKRGIYFMVDATQSFGGQSLSAEILQNIDVLACSTYKWLLGPYGHAFSYFSQEIIEITPPLSLSWLNVPTSSDVNNLVRYTTQTLPQRKYDRGQSPNMLLMSGLQESCEFLLDIGLENITKLNKELVHSFLSSYPKEHYEIQCHPSEVSNIVSLKTSRNGQEIKNALKKKNIDVSIREGKIRISFHLFNTPEQVEELLIALT